MFKNKNWCTVLLLIIIIIMIFNGILWYCYIYRNDERILNEEKKHITIEEKTINSATIPLNQLKKNILLEGDEKSYYELYNVVVVDSDCPEEFLFWSLIMANKYNIDYAYYDVFYSLAISCYENYNFESKESYYYPQCYKNINEVEYLSLDHLDDKTKRFAIEYLKIASDRGVSEAKKDLAKYYLAGVYVNKNEDLGRRLLEE